MKPIAKYTGGKKMPLPTAVNNPNPKPEELTVLIFGDPKSGKSTFCSNVSNALFLDTDNAGTKFLPVFRQDCNSWEDIQNTLRELKDTQHNFKTIVLDTVSNAIRYCRQYVCKSRGFVHESDDTKGFGRLWDLTKTEFLKMTQFIRGNLGMGLWFVSHADIKMRKIDGKDRPVTAISLSNTFGELVTAMCDVICYIDNDGSQRKLRVVPQDTLEVGDRTRKLTKDICFTSEKEAYDLFVSAFNKQEEKKK
jgi:hypothetical protein